jgi:hypothetical protein
MPVRNQEGKFVCLYHWDPKAGYWSSSPKPFTCSVLGLQHLKPTGRIDVLEGHWDYLAFLSYWKEGPGSAIGTCGSSFPQRFIPLLKDRDVTLFYDYDDAGATGVDSVASRCRGGAMPTTLKYMGWDSIPAPASDMLKEGYDLRDFTCAMIANPAFSSGGKPSTFGTAKKAARLGFLRAFCRPVNWETVQTVKPSACRSLGDLLTTFRTATPQMTITQSFEDCVVLCMAVHVSIRFDGDPLWMYLVGAPSSGKSTICELLSADERHTFTLSKFTGIVTGSPKGEHLAPKLNARCLVIKDGTLLLEGSKETLAGIYGELRDIYDGSLSIDYRNGRSGNFKNISFSAVMGMTERIYGLNTAILGERFLHCRLEMARETELERNRSAIRQVLTNSKPAVSDDNPDGDSRSFPVQRSAVAGFLQHMHSHIRDNTIIQPSYTTEDELLIQAMSDVIACSRASNDDDSYDARPEASTRVVKQVARLAMALCYVTESSSLNDYVVRLMLKVCLDSSFGHQYRIIDCIAQAGEAGINRQGVAMLTNIPLETMSRRLKSLEKLGILERELEDARQGRGRRNHVLKVAEWIRESFDRVRNRAASTVAMGFGEVATTEKKPHAATLRKTTLPPATPSPRKPVPTTPKGRVPRPATPARPIRKT